MGFKTGDRVIVSNKSQKYDGIYCYCKGTVETYHSQSGRYGVNIDNLHNECSGRGYFWFNDYDLNLLPNDTKETVKPTSTAGLTPNKILKSNEATIVFWSDGTKTVVKREADQKEDPYLAFTSALAKKIYGSNSRVKKIIATKTKLQTPKTKDVENAAKKLSDALRNIFKC